MTDEHLELTAHLLRRAGVGASREELEAFAHKDYGELVEDLLHPERFPDLGDDLLSRYFPALVNDGVEGPEVWSSRWIWRMANTKRPLEEKMALFWHHVFATGWFKSEHTHTMVAQIQMLRENGLNNLRTILLNLSRDPAMIYWLDNCESHASAPNENFGRELLELFSMGIGNYSETDVKMAGRAFTGWTFQQPIPLYPYGLYPATFLYRPEDHDDSEKTFLGHTGRLNGEDIIDIIVKQEATARFIARHLYNFFVADELQVSAWSVIAPQDPAAIDELAQAFLASDGDLRAVMRVLFNSEFFKSARFKRVKCPAEFIAGVLKLSGAMREPEPAFSSVGIQTQIMGQALFNAPSVEGWHTGKEWIDGGTLTDRVNFAVAQVRDPNKPGVQAIVRRLGANGSPVAPADFVSRCLELAGPVNAGSDTRAVLQRAADSGGDLRFDNDAATSESSQRIARMLSLIVAAPEYQFA